MENPGGVLKDAKEILKAFIELQHQNSKDKSVLKIHYKHHTYK